MKKKVVSISLICILVLGALAGIIIPIVYFIRGNWMQNLSNYMVDLDGATAFGISSNSNTARASSVNAIPNAKSNAISDKKHHKNYMVVQKDGSDDVYKVDFKKRHDKDHKNDHDSNISQDDMSAEIDKLYVLGDYTFISFVREGESKRPKDNKLEFDTDGIAIYDKRDYYTDYDRKSYIIDNTTGYIYAIVDFSISEIQGGCLLSKDDNYIYDFKITSNDELEIFSLFTNDSIEWFSCFKDKYGNKYIQNNVLNTYDSNTHTYFYVYGSGMFESNKSIKYELTSTNEAIKLIYDDYCRTCTSAKIITQDNLERDITREDNFNIYYHNSFFNDLDRISYYKVSNGVMFGHTGYKEIMQYNISLDLMYLDLCSGKKMIVRNVRATGEHNIAFLEKYNIVFEYYNNRLCYYSDVWDLILSGNEYQSGFFEGTLEDLEMSFVPEVVLENCSISDDKISFLTYGINGNTYYEVVVENVNGQVQVNSYVSGTYEQPQTKILLQPINK